jgi:hypothetical protein
MTLLIERPVKERTEVKPVEGDSTIDSATVDSIVDSAIASAVKEQKVARVGYAPGSRNSSAIQRGESRAWSLGGQVD